MWRKAYSLEWAKEQDFLCIKAVWDNETFVFPPLGVGYNGIEQVLDTLEDYFHQIGAPFLMKGATPDLVEYLQRLKPDYYNYREDRDNFDYLYRSEDLINLPGRKLNSKKNHMNYFKLHFNYRYEPISPDLIPACLESALAWGQKHTDDPVLHYEQMAINDALQNFSYLQLTGGAIIVYDKVEAFTLGEQLNSDTAVVHIEKGNADIRGIYQMINQQFCERQWSHLEYINREEDMGIAGLRQAKLSYRPFKMVEKYDVLVKGNGD